MRIRNLLSVVFVAVIFLSCEDDYERYSVENKELQAYLESFLEEARARGITDLNPEVTGLKLYFGSAENGAAGTTYYENPIRIVIDREMWNNYKATANGDNQNEHTVFHELAHALMYRSHDNSTFNSGEWKTMMVGDPLPDDQIPNTNFRGFRRTYYLDQLFRPASTGTPEWVNPKYSKDNSGLTNKVDDDFSGSYVKGHWISGLSSGKFSAGVNNGEYVFQNISSGTVYEFGLQKATAVNCGDTYFEAQLKFETIGNKDPFVYIAMGDTVGEDNYHYIALYSGKKTYIGNTKSYGPYAQIAAPVSVMDNYTNVAFRKDGNYIYYKIGETWVYKDTIDTKIEGGMFGFVVSPQTVLRIRNISIWNGASVARSVSIDNAAMNHPNFQFIRKGKEINIRRTRN